MAPDADQARNLVCPDQGAIFFSPGNTLRGAKNSKCVCPIQAHDTKFDVTNADRARNLLCLDLRRHLSVDVFY